jgi:hypothetical protein
MGGIFSGFFKFSGFSGKVNIPGILTWGFPRGFPGILESGYPGRRYRSVGGGRAAET